MYLTTKNKLNNVITNESIFCELENHIVQHPKYDLCAVDISHVYANILANNKEPFMTYIPLESIISDFSIFNHIEEIYMVGYPNKLINVNTNYPIIRKGITATGLCDQLGTDDAFIVDIPVYRGSSGSPIFHIDNNGKVRLVGIAESKYYEINHLFVDNNGQIEENKDKFIKVPNGLGYAIKANIILDLINNIPYN